MNDDALTELMHAVLEGMTSPEQAEILRNLLAQNALAAEEFEGWRLIFRGLAETPQAHPPEGLVAAISAAIPMRALPGSSAAAKYFSDATQLSASKRVIDLGMASRRGSSFSFPAFFSRPRRPLSTTRESVHMNLNRKVLAGGALGAVALGLAVIMSGLPPKAENVVGTIVPAERYRAPQSGAEAVQLGQPATASADLGNAATANRADAARADKMADKAADKLADKAADKLADKAADKLADKAADKLADKAADKLADKAADKLADKAADKLADKAADKLADKAADRLADKAADKLADKAADKLADKATSN